MARAPFQVAVFPFRQTSQGTWEYAIFRRQVEGYWQSIAGGGEDEETPLDAARREASEEANLSVSCQYYDLQTKASVPVTHFRNRDHWESDLFVVPIHYFGADATDSKILLSREHSEHQWVDLERGLSLLRWDSDKTALWELEQLLSLRSKA